MNRVIIYAHYLPPEPSACSTRIASLARHLLTKGYRPTLLTSRPHHQASNEFDVVRVRGRLGLLRWLWREQPCPIMISSPPATPASEVALLAKLLGYQLVVDIRDPYVAEARKLGEIPPGWRLWMKERLERMLLSSTRRISFVSEDLRAAMTELQGTPFPESIIAPNGVDLKVFPANANKRVTTRLKLGLGDSPVFIYQGILGGKELDQTFLALFPVLDRHDARVIVAAVSNEYSINLLSQFRNMVAKAGMKNRFYWLENLNSEQLAEAMCAADFGLNPLPKHRAYCLPVKTFEYMACGLYNISIASESSPLHNIFQDPSLGIVTTNWEAFQIAADSAAENTQNLRSFTEYRSDVARKYYSRQIANDRIEFLLRAATLAHFK